MAHHVKLPACANCAYPFMPDEPDEFCPRCGQQNHDVNLSVGHVLEEGLEGIFHFDSKVFRTLGLLLFKPGQLTRRFLSGHRVPYVPPIRLYVFISFVFFLLLSLTSGNLFKEQREQGRKQTTQQQRQAEARQAQGQLDSARRELKAQLGPQGAALIRPEIDSAVANAAKAKPGNSGVNFSIGGVKLSDEELRRLPAELEPAQVDSILQSKKEALTYFHRLGVRRAVRWSHSTREEVLHQALRGGSILLFFLMPLAALLLKGFYLRRGRFYLSHLIFTIHMHCFIFVVLALSLLVDKLTPESWDLSGLVTLVLGVYFVLALRRVYGQGWLKTIFKSLLLGFTYSLALIFSTLVVAVLGFAIF